MASNKNTRNMAIDVCMEVVKNFSLAFLPLRAWRLKRPRAGAVFGRRDEDLERYAFFGTRNLIGLLGSVKGLHIVEVGPGDYLTSGLSLLAAGAASYTAVDRFPGDHSGATAKEWYRGIQSAWSRFFPSFPWPDYLKADDFPEGYPDRIEVLSTPVEELRQKRRYDVVCSYQVGEHVSDIHVFARMNALLLKPGGTAVHRVDFSPHGCWSAYPDPLTFLRFPDWLWNLMGAHRGIPNRHRHDEFCAAFEAAGLKVDATNLERYEPEQVDRARLVKRFQHAPQESLLVSAATYVCRL